MDEITEREVSMDEVNARVRAGDVQSFRDTNILHGMQLVTNAIVGNSLLRSACQSGVLGMLLQVIQTLQENGCSIPSVDKEIALCVDLGHHQLIEPLLKYGSVDVNHVFVNGRSLIDSAAANGDIDTFRELQRLGAIASDTVVPLASDQNRLPFLQHLLTTQPNEYNLNFQDQRGKSSAHLAAEKGNTGVVQLLLEKGLDINLKDKRDFNILHSAASGGSVPTVKAVLEACERQNVLHQMLTARDRYDGSERCFLVRGVDNDQPVEVPPGHGGHIYVASYGSAVTSGSDTWVQQDMQPLHVAISKKHEEVALVLTAVMDDVGQPDSFGLTPLHLAAKRGHNKLIEALLEKGAPYKVADALGRTPMDIAKASGQQTAVKLLKLRAKADAIEGLRYKLRGADRDLAFPKLQRLVQEGGDPESYMASTLRDVVGDVNDFTFDCLHRTSVVTESGVA